MRTTILIKVEMADDQFDCLEIRAKYVNKWSLELLEDIFNDALFYELGLVGKTTVTKIE